LVNLAIYQKHIGNEANAQITVGKAEKLQRAILKTEEDQIAAAAAQISSPMGEDKREDEEKERPAGDEKGLCSPMFSPFNNIHLLVSSQKKHRRVLTLN
jgi:hypothetical protein